MSGGTEASQKAFSRARGYALLLGKGKDGPNPQAAATPPKPMAKEKSAPRPPHVTNRPQRRPPPNAKKKNCHARLVSLYTQRSMLAQQLDMLRRLSNAHARVGRKRLWGDALGPPGARFFV